MPKIWTWLVIMLVIVALGFSFLIYSGKYDKPASVYALGDSVSYYKTKDNARKYMLAGWSRQENGYTWTDGKEASMLFDVQNAEDKNLLLQIRAFAYLGGGLPCQTVDVYANEIKTASWKITNEAWHEAEIPYTAAGDGLIKIKLTISDPTSPKEIGKSTDERKLGIAVKELIISVKD